MKLTGVKLPKKLVLAVYNRNKAIHRSETAIPAAADSFPKKDNRSRPDYKSVARRPYFAVLNRMCRRNSGTNAIAVIAIITSRKVSAIVLASISHLAKSTLTEYTPEITYVRIFPLGNSSPIPEEPDAAIFFHARLVGLIST
jgi:hypothetical protein